MLLLIGKGYKSASPERIKVRIVYETTLETLPTGTHKLQIWIPFPMETPVQSIQNVTIEGPYKSDFTKEPEYGNQMIYFYTDKISSSNNTFRISFDMTRKKQNGGVSSNNSDQLIKRYLRADAMVPFNQTLRDLADQALPTQKPVQAMAKDLYNFVLTHMEYNKKRSGWGKGNATRACIVGLGNCTDYHSLFNGLARIKNIPSKFIIGFPIGPHKIASSINGYHCWAEFYDPSSGWIPVDISEADKKPKKAEDYFGKVPADRVAFSEGRDITLAPPQSGKPLNYFIYPYAELDGKPFTAIKTIVSHFPLASQI